MTHDRDTAEASRLMQPKRLIPMKDPYDDPAMHERLKAAEEQRLVRFLRRQRVFYGLCLAFLTGVGLGLALLIYRLLSKGHL